MSSLIFPKELRIPYRDEISRIQRNGQKVYTNGFIVAFLESQREYPRLAVTVSKKVHKRAVVRNRIKRHIREVFRQLRPRFVRNVDIVVIARQDAVGGAYGECFTQVSKALLSKRVISRSLHSS